MLDNASILAYEVSVCLIVPISGEMCLNTEKNKNQLNLTKALLIIVGFLLVFPHVLYSSIFESEGDIVYSVTSLIFKTSTSLVTLSSLFTYEIITNTFVMTCEKLYKELNTTINEIKLQTCIDLHVSYGKLQQKCGKYFLVTFLIYGFCFIITTFWVCIEFLAGNLFYSLLLSGYPIQLYLFLYHISNTAGKTFESFENLKNKVR